MESKVKKCYIYTRVSTAMQVEGYSLDAQRERLHRHAEYENMVIAGEYTDEGKSGKSVEGRPEFMKMLKDIQTNKDGVSYVLVYKLSRFGRNAADVLNSLQTMQDYGVNLICVEDGIDSSKEAGKLMISVLSAVAEIERENIRVQTMEGRKQKAREGRWNGGFAPYGYKLVNGALEIEPKEAEAVRIIYDKFVFSNMGYVSVAKYLERNGIVKKARQTGYLTQFSSSIVKGIIDNPVYCGKIAYGRRKTEKVSGTRNQYHIVMQKEYPMYDGIHEAIVDEETWKLAQEKRRATGKKRVRKHNLEHEHILSGILKCPLCHSSLYGNVSRKKREDGTFYKDYYYYACKHRQMIEGHKCSYKKQWSEDVIDGAVVEIIKKLVNNPRFAEVIKSKINKKIDTKEIETELENVQKQLKQADGTKDKLAAQIDALDVFDRNYERKFDDLQNRLDAIYEKIAEYEDVAEELETKLANLRREQLTGDNVYQFLLLFDKVYDKFTDMEKKQFFNSFVSEIHIYETEQPNGQILKSIKFKFPVFYDGIETDIICLDNQGSVESVSLLVRRQGE